MSVRLALIAAALALAVGCSLTPIPDVTSEWVDPCESESQRRCPVTFSLAAGSEMTAELRGDFRDGGWTTGGEPMTKPGDGGTWSATIDAPWHGAVQYKFFLDGSRWILDPANPKTVPDGKGNTNSLLDGIDCLKWSCAP